MGLARSQSSSIFFGDGYTINPQDLIQQAPQAQPNVAISPAAPNTQHQSQDQAEEEEQEEQMTDRKRWWQMNHDRMWWLWQCLMRRR